MLASLLLLAAPASGQPPAASSTTQSGSAAPPAALMPGVTSQRVVELTPHGPVALTVITTPPPTGLYTIGPALSGGTISDGREPVTQLEQDVSASATVAGINGDFFSGRDSHPNGIVMSGGQLEHGPNPARSSIGFDATGSMHVGRISFTGTWQGSGQRRPVLGVNQAPRANQTVLFTPAWGPTTPGFANAVTIVLEPFPAPVVNSDLKATVASVGAGATPIPADGAVLVATGSAAAKLTDEAPAGGSVTVRLVVPDTWSNVVSAVGGGPLLVRGGKPVFTTSESFISGDLTSRNARAAVGQLRDGRVILVAVDGRRPGYSVGMTSYELAQAMARLGSVTAAGLQFGSFVTAAFDGQLLNRPSDPSGARPVKEALLVQYQGVYAPPPPVPVVGKDAAATGEQLSYRIVRPSTVVANVIGPDGVSHPVDSGQKQPGTYTFTWASFDAEGTWHWNIQATDDLNRASTADQVFQYDLTLTGLSVPHSVSSSTGLRAGFTLSRPAAVTLQIDAANGTVANVLPTVQLGAGAQTVAWDGMTATGTAAPPGAYIARISETSSVGTVVSTAAFTLHR